ncbi:MAG: hypothetical protein LBB95_00010 [Mycoplasmataceae bacterium]|jgi:uncharacterized protein with PQ loop repeat|nr:hypothetical protein [Mycoplasmataceae bacterium]
MDHTNIAFLVTGILSFIFGLSNSIPAFLRVWHTKKSSSLSLYTQILRVIVGIIVIATLVGKLLKYWNTGSQKIHIEPWRICSTLDVICNVFGFFCASYILIHRFITYKPGDESFKKYFKFEGKYIVIYIIFAIVVISDIATVIHYKMHTNITVQWIFWCGCVSSVLGIFTMLPLTIRVIITKDTYSISLIAEISLVIAMIFWTSYDAIGLHNDVHENLPYFIADIYTSIWVAIIFAYKLSDTIKQKKNIVL